MLFTCLVSSYQTYSKLLYYGNILNMYITILVYFQFQNQETVTYRLVSIMKGYCVELLIPQPLQLSWKQFLKTMNDSNKTYYWVNQNDFKSVLSSCCYISLFSILYILLLLFMMRLIWIKKALLLFSVFLFLINF